MDRDVLIRAVTDGIMELSEPELKKFLVEFERRKAEHYGQSERQ